MAIYDNPKIVTNGLILYLDAANIRSYPKSGTAWTDLSGQGNNGTLTNGPTYSQDNGGGFLFDGVNDYVDTGNINYLFNTPFTISMWIKFASVSSVSALVSTYGPGNDGFFIEIPAGGTGVRFVYRNLGVDKFDFTATKTISTGVFYNIVGVCYDGVGRVFVDSLDIGHQGFTSPGFFSVAKNSVDINRLSVANLRYANATTYSVQIHRLALSPQEIAQNFNATRKRFGI